MISILLLACQTTQKTDTGNQTQKIQDPWVLQRTDQRTGDPDIYYMVDISVQVCQKMSFISSLEHPRQMFWSEKGSLQIYLCLLISLKLPTVLRLLGGSIVLVVIPLHSMANLS